jgi:hypothetical protein
VERKPDVYEILTDDQLTLAVAEWLFAKERMKPGEYESHHLVVTPDGTHVYQAWKK